VQERRRKVHIITVLISLSFSSAYDTMEYTVDEVKRVTRMAGQLASKRKNKITSVDKANVLATSRMWRKVVEQTLKEEFPTVTLERIFNKHRN
jgi:isocitrate/isopropylmalate dehydrogenase